MNEMTEDDEAKQRAHEVANQSQSLYATGSPTNHNDDKTKGVQISRHSPMERNIEDGERMTTIKNHVVDDNQEVTQNESSEDVENQNQNETRDQHEQKSTDRPNHDQQTTTSNRQNRRHHHNNIHHHHHNNNNNSPNNHQRKLQYTSSAVMGQDGTAAGAGPFVSADYLAQLIKDKKQLAAFPTTVLLHVPRLVEEEIQRVRQQLFQLNDVVSSHQQPLELPEPDGEFVSLQEKIYVPVDQHPEYNFVGRLLGPRGMTAKQLEQETGCKIMIRGKGSMRDKKKEEQNRGKANWEHLNDDLHVLITVEDTQSRAQVKLGRAIQEVKQLLVPVVDGEDELKKRQLMELAIINGTYRDCNYNEALSKMLNDAAYRQSQLVEHGSPTRSGQQQSMTGTAATASASSSGSPPSGQLVASRHLLTHMQHYPSSTTASTNFDGSSGFPSTGSTPNSLHHGASHQQVATSSQHPHNRHQSHPHHGAPTTHHHHPAHLNHPTTVAVVAAAAAAAAAQQHHQASGPPQTASSHHHQQQLHHAHSHQSPAVAAAAAAAALMSNPTAEANAILYAQQYHDFQHYAAMAAAVAASHQSILPPPPLDYNPHHPHHAYPPPHHPHPHHHHAAVAQAVAAATAANQQFHRQIAQQQHQQHNAEALASTHDMVNYQQQDQQIDNGNDQNDFQNLPLIEESSGVTSEQSSEQQQQQLQQEQVPN